MSGAAILNGSNFEFVQEATRAYLAELRKVAEVEDPTWATNNASAHAGVVVAMAVQALCQKGVHEPGVEFRALLRALGMGWGGLIADLGPVGQATAVDTFNDGAEWAEAAARLGAGPTKGSA